MAHQSQCSQCNLQQAQMGWMRSQASHLQTVKQKGNVVKNAKAFVVKVTLLCK